MTTSYRDRKNLVRDALACHGGKVVDAGGGRWELKVGTGANDCIGVHLQNDWVLCSFPLTPMFGSWNVETYDSRLSANPRLPGWCKFVLDPWTSALHVREDIAIVDGIDLSRRCTEAIANLEAVRAALVKKPRAARKRKTTPLPKEVTGALEEVCKETGWDYAGREDGTGAATLALPNRSVRAEVMAYGKRDIRVAVPLSGFESLSDIGRRAAAVLLLTVNDLVRFARAGVERSAGLANAFVEVPFRGRPSAALLDTALSALAVSCGLCERELTALADESVARRYLNARGKSSEQALSSVAL